MRIVITGGGTGGHLFPGIALAGGMQRLRERCEILFITTARTLDLEVLAGQTFSCRPLAFSGIKGKGLRGSLLSLARLPGAVGRAYGMIRSFRPQLVFGVGGYVTVPVLLAAKLQRIPVCIHEQNSVPGLANRLLARIADRIFLSLPCKGVGGSKVVLAGNPVRQSIVEAAELRTGKVGTGSPCILVLGGSQGAHALNLLMLDAVEQLAAADGTTAAVRIRVIHQTGRADYELVRKRYGQLGIEAEVNPFFRDMASIYSQADLVVARAGATSLAELAVMGLPALLVPYPYAADNHQEKNARYYEQQGGALVMREQELDGAELAVTIQRLLRDSVRLHAMARKMRQAGRPEAVHLIVQGCLDMVKCS